jgi:pectin methylesterase-like acyl-CoA thioesterase
MKENIITSIIVLMLSVFSAFGQLPGSRTYDFRDGNIITNGKSDDGSLTLNGGSYKLHGAQYGLNMKVGGAIKIAVSKSSTVKFLGSKYSALKMEAKTSSGTNLGTQNTQVVNDLADTFDFVYDGGADTLSFTLVAGTGNDLYCPSIEVVPLQVGSEETLTAAAKNIIYYFDLRYGSIIPNETTLNGNYTIEKGLFKIESGSSNAYGYNGTQWGSILKTGNKITLKVAGNSYVKIAGCPYSNGAVSISSTTGVFDKDAQSTATTSYYSADSTTVDFLYVGTEGDVTLEFTAGTTYIPLIKIVPVPFDVQLDPWVKKAGVITVNGVDIHLTAGDTSTDNATVTVSEGTVISATSAIASVRINLSGNALSTYTPAVSGQIASVVVSNDTLLVAYADETSKPNSYKILVADNSATIEAEAGKTYSYNFADGSVLPQTSYQALRYTTFISADNIITINSNTATESRQFGYHDSAHGAVFFPGNSVKMKVAGNATVTFIVCTYGSATDAIFEFTDADNNVLGSCAAQNIGGADGFASNFTYTGSKGEITATLKSENAPTAEVYIHGLSIENAAIIEEPTGKIEVWDFGAAQLDAGIYKNNLSVDIINSWYASSITPGTSNVVLPAFTAGVLSWVGGSNDRLRTTNTAITRYDENIGGVADYTGRVYVNASAATGRYMSITLSEDDEVTVVAKTDAGGVLNFQYVPDPTAQTDVVPLTSDLVTLKFVAKAGGAFHIFDSQGKPSYYRIYRKDATYVNLGGALNVTNAAGIPDGYGIVFKNAAGKTWTSIVSNGNYTAKLPAGYTYSLSLSDANGYIISNGNSLEVTESTTSYNITVNKVELYTVSGSISGIPSVNANLSLAYTPEESPNTIFVPKAVVNVTESTYTVQLEPNVKYRISAVGVNDYFIEKDSITIGQANEISDIVFAAKPVYKVTFTANGLTEEQLAKLSLTLTNMNEAGYSYNFSSVDNVELRNGVYTLSYSGLDEYPVEAGLTSNLQVNGEPTSKVLSFKPVNVWSFNDKVITNSTPAYKGMLFSGNIANEIAKGHLTAKFGSSIQVPVKVGEKLIVTYYYSAAFSINGGDTITTASNSTSVFETAEYVYAGTADGYITIVPGTAAATTYLTEISTVKVVETQSTLHVGTDKPYKTINEALTAVSMMNRPSAERVVIMIDPGNYEEMLVVNVANVTLKNAVANPSIALLNKGVDIDANAVRITSYYGHGYNYYSMGNDQKWHADILAVNKENGYLSYENKGAGTTNGSWWNATVVVAANGFEADGIIFENSFNQYISKKESEDVVVMWESGNKGLRPTAVGNTDVQHKSFVERAAAIAIANNIDKVVLNKCRVIGRQDSFFGGINSRVVVYKGAMMGGTDYIFGGMVAVFYKSDLVMNTSDDSGDVCYITAAQQSSGRGYLMYECKITSPVPGVESAASYLSKPGYFGRPWQATTSEVVFYNTTIDTTNVAGSVGKSLINPAGWLSSLGGESNKMYEFGTIEMSGENNQAGRASWSTVLNAPTLTGGTEITTLNFTKGTDGWDPIPALIAADIESSVFTPTAATSSVQIFANGNRMYISNVKSDTKINVYRLDGSLVSTMVTNVDTNFTINNGLWIVRAIAADGSKAVKVLIK